MELPGPSSSSTSGDVSRLHLENPNNISNSALPRTCQNCYLSHMQLVVYYFGQPEKVIKYCQDHGVISSESDILCPTCSTQCRLDLRRKAFRCDKSYSVRKKKRRRCNFFVSIFKGTWFGKSQVDIETNFFLVYIYLSDTLFTYKYVENELGLSKTTINDWCSFVREVVLHWVLGNKSKIGGVGTTVEIDESKFGKRKYNVGRLVTGQWVFGGICRETREFFAVPVENRDTSTLLAILHDYVEPGTTIISDCWKAYDCLSDEGFVHIKVNHSLNFVDPESGAHTNTIERRWRDLKNLVPKFGRRKEQFVAYLALAYFKLHFKDPNTRLHVFFNMAAQLYPPEKSIS